MQAVRAWIYLPSIILLTTSCSLSRNIDQPGDHASTRPAGHSQVQLGPRPLYLVDDMDAGWLKEKLRSCEHGPFYRTDFSIGHRGAPLQFPEHTRQSYIAAARMGAGILECDVTFTRDRHLVCRHSQCDLHTTTNILATDLAAKCAEPFTPARFDKDGNLIEKASAKCCTSDISLAGFKSLTGKMDAADSSATTVEQYLGGTTDWRTDLYSANGTLLSHRESIELFRALGVKMTPELKSPSVDMPFEGDYSQQDYARQMIDEYRELQVPPRDVYPQSFNLEDIKYWIENHPAFGQQAVYLDGRYSLNSFNHRDPASWSPTMQQLATDGVQIIAPPMWMLLDLDQRGEIAPSVYAEHARHSGLDIITWTFERSDLRAGATTDTWYHQTTADAIDSAGDKYQALHVLAREVSVLGVFSDWPATVTYYANCMQLD
jgi:glycerophosphoryl diester phosphodiesterase